MPILMTTNLLALDTKDNLFVTCYHDRVESAQSTTHNSHVLPQMNTFQRKHCIAHWRGPRVHINSLFLWRKFSFSPWLPLKTCSLTFRCVCGHPKEVFECEIFAEETGVYKGTTFFFPKRQSQKNLTQIARFLPLPFLVVHCLSFM